MNCAICHYSLPHSDLEEKHCQREVLKHFERSLIEAKAEIKKLELELKLVKIHEKNLLDPKYRKSHCLELSEN